MIRRAAAWTVAVRIDSWWRVAARSCAVGIRCAIRVAISVGDVGEDAVGGMVGDGLVVSACRVLARVVRSSAGL